MDVSSVDSVWLDQVLWPGGEGDRTAHSNTSRRTGLLYEPGGCGNSLSSGSSRGWRDGRISLGNRSQKSIARNGRSLMYRWRAGVLASPPSSPCMSVIKFTSEEYYSL